MRCLGAQLPWHPPCSSPWGVATTNSLETSTECSSPPSTPQRLIRSRSTSPRINRYSILKVEEEQKLARQFAKGDLQAGHRLVTANLRFVVKVAYEYRSYGIRMADLIQEGNIGLMKAVQKFDPDKGIRLISYAVWWIRAYIQNYILKSWSLVKLGTTQAQRKLFFWLARTRRELERTTSPTRRHPGRGNCQAAAGQARRSPRDGPADGRARPLPGCADGRGRRHTHVDFVASSAQGQDDEVADKRAGGIINSRVRMALTRLDPRERFIIEQRVMSEPPMTLKELGEHFGFCRERARQLEIRAKEKLKCELAALMAEMEPDAAAA